MFQNFLLRKMLKGQGVPEDQIDMVLALFQKNPDLFKQIAEEVKAEIKNGKDPATASMSIMQKHESQLKELIGK
jgi:hypothetical protein